MSTAAKHRGNEEIEKRAWHCVGVLGSVAIDIIQRSSCAGYDIAIKQNWSRGYPCF
jgi:hypothetical protein